MSDSAKLKNKSPTSKQRATGVTSINTAPVSDLQQNTSPKLNRTTSKSKLGTISPFLSPKSANSYDRASSPGKLTRSSTQQEDSAKKGVKSPSLFRTSSTAALSNASNSPMRSPKRTLTGRSTSTEKTRPISAFGQQFYHDNKNISEAMKSAGSEYFGVKTDSKRLEQELKALENRVQKLKSEEESSVKRLEKTQDQCQKVIENKVRHQNDLIDSEYRKQQNMANLAKQRKEQMEAKMKLNEDILRSMINTMNHKNGQAQEVKQTIQEAKEVYAQETNEKNKVRDKTIQEIQDLRQRLVEERRNKEESAKEFALVTNHSEKLDAERKRQEEINRRLELLTREEEALLERIRATNTLQENTFMKMEKVFSMRVTADKPLELP